MANQGYVRGITRLSKLKAMTQIAKLKGMTRLAIAWSMGRLEEFSVGFFADDSILQYLYDRTSVLKKLCLISCWQLSDEAIAETAKRQPLLEELQITFGSFHGATTEIVGKECPQLKRFKLDISQYDIDSNEVAALGIAKTMHQLCHLQLVGSRLTNWGLKAILDGCPHLETLDIRQCFYVNMDANMRACCARLKTIRLPSDYVADNEFEGDADCVYSFDLDDFHDYYCDYDDIYNFNDYDMDDYDIYLYRQGRNQGMC